MHNFVFYTFRQKYLIYILSNSHLFYNKNRVNHHQLTQNNQKISPSIVYMLFIDENEHNNHYYFNIEGANVIHVVAQALFFSQFSLNFYVGIKFNAPTFIINSYYRYIFIRNRIYI